MIKKKKLIWQIFPSFLIIIVLSLSSVTSYSTRYFKEFFLKNSEKELTTRAELLQINFADILPEDMMDADQDQIRHIDELCKDIGEKTGTRVTIISPFRCCGGRFFRGY